MAQPRQPLCIWLIWLVSALIVMGPLSFSYANSPTELKKMLRLGNYEGAQRLLLENTADPEQAFQLARLYQQKLVKPPRPNAAFNLFKQAADTGHVEATYQLAKFYERGEQTPQNLDMARATYRKAISLDHPKAERALARLSTEKSLPELSIEEALRQCNENAIIKIVAGRSKFEQSWMFQAIDCNGTESLYTALLSAGAKPDAQDEQQNLALHKAIAREAVAAAIVLKRAGADLHRKNGQGWSATMLAERSDNKVLRKVLNVPDNNPTRSTSTNLSVASKEARFKGWSPLHIAAWRGDQKLINKLIRDGVAVNKVDRTGVTAMTRALQSNNIDTAYLLLDKGSELSSADFNLVSDLQDNKLIKKISSSSEKIVEAFFCHNLAQGNNEVLHVLLASGTSAPALCGAKPALVLAARNSDQKTLTNLLSKQADVDAADELGCTALCWAIKTDHADIASLLMSSGAGNKPDHNGTTPLMWAAQTGNLKAVRQLLDLNVDINQQSKSGSHALLLAATEGHTDIVVLLLANEASIDLKNALGDTALIAAVKADNYATAKLLVTSGASTRARNAMFVSARELLQSKDEQWQKLIDEKSSFWSLIN